MSMVARALVEHGHDVKQFDFLSSGTELNNIASIINEIKPDVVGISMRNIDNVNMLCEEKYTGLVKQIVKTIKDNTKAPVFLGGTAYSILPEQMLEEVGADYGIVGEGEKLAVELVELLEKKQLPENRIFSSSPSLIGTQMRPAIYDKQIMKYYIENGTIPGVQSKRGCTHKCIYCSYPYLEGSTFRARDVQETVDDIECLTNEHNAKMIFFTDSVFNDEQGYYIELLEEMKRRKVVVPWTAYIKPEKIEDSVLKLMKETGVKGVELGSDASTDETLRGIGKSFTFDNIIECNTCFTEHDIATANYFMFGGPNETKQTVLKGIDNITSLQNTVSFMFMGIRIVPNTPLADLAKKQGVISECEDLLDTKYYISPSLDKDWLESTLHAGFKKYRHCVFPPNALDSSVKFLQKMGHKGLMWDMLIPNKVKKDRR
jgi:radical SAM superfamily enzyme YgiQ (UPF0313 family)